MTPETGRLLSAGSRADIESLLVGSIVLSPGDSECIQAYECCWLLRSCWLQRVWQVHNFAQVSQIERTGGLEPSQYANVLIDLPDTNAALLCVDVCVDVVGSWKGLLLRFCWLLDARSDGCISMPRCSIFLTTSDAMQLAKAIWS